MSRRAFALALVLCALSANRASAQKTFSCNGHILPAPCPTTPTPAIPIGVSYTVAGGPGDWIFNFTVSNNLTGTPYQSLYLFAIVASSNTEITGIPTTTPTIGDWVIGPAPGEAPTINTKHIFGVGPDVDFNRIWQAEPFCFSAPAPDLRSCLNLPGASISGFTLTSTDAVAPTSFNWLAYTADECAPAACYAASLYYGPGNILNDPDVIGASGGDPGYNPAFVGVTTAGGDAPTATPEPNTLWLLTTGLSGVGVMAMWRRPRGRR